MSIWNFKFRCFLIALVGGFFHSVALSETITTSGNQSLPLVVQSQGVSRVFYEHSYALIVENADYKTVRSTDDKGSYRESTDFTNLFESQGFQVTTALDVIGANRHGYTFIKNFILTHNGPNDRLVLVFIGHGAAFDDSGYFLFVDAQRLNDERKLAQFSLSSNDIQQLIHLSKAKHVAVFMNACFTGGVLSTLSATYENPLERRTGVKALPIETYLDYSKSARQYLTAGSNVQLVPLPSLYTPAVIRAIAGEADPFQSGIVSLTQVASWVYSYISNVPDGPIRTTPRYGDVIPSNSSELATIGGTMIFAYDGRAPSLQSRLANLVPNVIPVPGSSLPSTPDSVLGEQAIHPAPWRKWDYAPTKVQYFEKGGDGDVVIKAMSDYGIPLYSEKRSFRPQSERSNMLACLPGTPIGAIKQTAEALMARGIPLKIIAEAHNKAVIAHYGLQVLNARRGDGYRVLTHEDVDKLTKCPSEDGVHSPL